jgi:hypothetical protein
LGISDEERREDRGLNDITQKVRLFKQQISNDISAISKHEPRCEGVDDQREASIPVANPDCEEDRALRAVPVGMLREG